MTDKVILRAENIVKKFPGTIALNGVSIELKAGEVHAIVGENGAGKSTMMNVLSGVLTPDSGKIFVKGKEASYKSPRDAQHLGIGMVHQELALCPEVTVGDNIFIGKLPTKSGFVDRKKLYKDTANALKPFDMDIKPDDQVAYLSAAKQQVIEIAKALAMDCKVIIFDEPTSSLNEKEAQLLFKVIEEIAKKGIGVFYITHKLSEVFQICDRITVLRNGKLVGTHDRKSVTADEVVSEMVGRKMGSYYPQKSTISDDKELFRVEGFTVPNKFLDVSFSVKKGEILGLYGLVGSGRTEVARAICGIDLKKSGRVLIDGKQIKINNYKDALDNGICYLSEDRKLDGLFLSMSVADNMIAPQVDKIAKNKFLSKRVINKLTLDYKDKLNTKFSSPNQSINSLSGGNQQKIMVAKLLATNPKVIIMDEPTRGIDVGAKLEIHSILRDLCNKGIGVVVISSELPEIIGISDRVVVMYEGEVIGDIRGDIITQDNIIAKITEYTDKREEKAYETV